jgi:hypothetical protein
MLAEVIAVIDKDGWLHRYNFAGGKPRFPFAQIKFDALVILEKLTFLILSKIEGSGI